MHGSSRQARQPIYGKLIADADEDHLRVQMLAAAPAENAAHGKHRTAAYGVDTNTESIFCSGTLGSECPTYKTLTARRKRIFEKNKCEQFKRRRSFIHVMQHIGHMHLLQPCEQNYRNEQVLFKDVRVYIRHVTEVNWENTSTSSAAAAFHL